MNDPKSGTGGYKFIGTTEECLVAYGETLPTGRASSEARKPMADYTKADNHTVYRWLAGKSRPIGDNLISCRIFLERQGYLCTELREIRPQALDVAELIYDGKVDFDDARRALGIKTRDSFLALLRGANRVAPKCVRRWNNFLAPYKKKEAEKKIVSNAPVNISLPRDPDELRHHATIGVLANMVQAMEPVALYMLLDKFTDEERRQLRNSIPNNGLERLARMLLALCSKRSRDLFMEELKAQKGKGKV